MRRDPLDIDVTPPGLRRRSGRALAVAACCALSAIARAADDEVALAIRPPPLIERILPPAARSGGTVRLRIEGKRLDGIESLVASHEGIRAERIVEPPSESEIEDAKKRNRAPPAPRVLWDLSVAESVPPGYYELRVRGASGLSGPRLIHVAPTELVDGADPTRGEPREIAAERRYSGRIERDRVESWVFRASESRRLVVEVHGERIDSMIDATIEVSRDGRRVAFAMDVAGSDPIVAFDAEKDAEYRIDVWDLTYQDGFPYLIEVSSTPRVLGVDPPVVRSESTSPATIVGWNLPGGEAIEGHPWRLERASVEIPPADSGAVRSTYRSSAESVPGTVDVRVLGDASPALPLLAIECDVEVMPESEPNDTLEQARMVSGDALISGRFESRRDRDSFVFEAKKGDLFELEVFAGRFGLARDVVLSLGRVADDGAIRGLELADERQAAWARENAITRRLVPPTRDPYLVWKAPDDGRYIVSLRSRGRDDADLSSYLFRLRTARPDFILWAMPSDAAFAGAPTVRRGGAQAFDVIVERRGGFAGDVEIGVDGLPEAIHADKVTFGPDQAIGSIVVAADPGAPDWHGPVTIRAKSAEPVIDRTAIGVVMPYGTRENRHPLQYPHSRCATSLAIDVRGRSPFGVDIDRRSFRCAPGAKLSVALRVVRQDGFDAPLRVSFVGFNDRGYPNENGEREAKVTIGKDKSEDSYQLSVSNNVAFGRYAYFAYASSEIEYPLDPGDPKSRKDRFWYTEAAPPIVVDVCPPADFAVGALPETTGEDGQSFAPLERGGSLRVPVTVTRLDGVTDNVELELRIEGDSSGVSAKKVTLGSDQSAVDLVLECAENAPLGDLRLAVFARIRHAGRNYDREIPLQTLVRRLEKKEDAAAGPDGSAGGQRANNPVDGGG